jgi:hypothetical protein
MNFLYSKKSKIATLCEYDCSKISLNNLNPCALFSNHEILPLELILNNPVNLYALKNYEGEFCVATEELQVIAFVKDNQIKFPQDLTFLYQAHELKCGKKLFLNVRYFLNIPCLWYVKYFSCLHKISHSYIIPRGTMACFECLPYCSTPCARSFEASCTPCIIFGFLLFLFFCFAELSLKYYAVMFPFYGLALPFQYYFFDFEYRTLWIFPSILASTYLLIFPQFTLLFQKEEAFQVNLKSIMNHFQLQSTSSTVRFAKLLKQREKFGVSKSLISKTLLFSLGIFLIGFVVMFYISNSISFVKSISLAFGEAGEFKYNGFDIIY